MVLVQVKNKKCIICGSTEDLTTDHVLPKAFGGDDQHDNQAVMCYQCNYVKGSLFLYSLVNKRIGLKRAIFLMRSKFYQSHDYINTSKNLSRLRRYDLTNNLSQLHSVLSYIDPAFKEVKPIVPPAKKPKPVKSIFDVGYSTAIRVGVNVFDDYGRYIKNVNLGPFPILDNESADDIINSHLFLKFLKIKVVNKVEDGFYPGGLYARKGTAALLFDINLPRNLFD